MTPHRFLGVIGALALLGVSFAQSATAVELRPVLTLDVARKMADACMQKAVSEGWNMHIAIMDNHGNLKLYTRMDDAQLISHQIALAKARTSASIPLATTRIRDFAYGNEEQRPGPIAFVPGIQMFEGGLPIKTAAGAHIGGIGVSGSTGVNDGICAQAALDAVVEELL